ncbi:hypothetical protein V8B97DRAFT_2009106 [Scleroderma yunnanense]
MSEDPTLLESAGQSPAIHTYFQGHEGFLKATKSGYKEDPVLAKIIKNPDHHPTFDVNDGLIHTMNSGGEKYQQHISMDLIMETPDIMWACKDCLAVLFNVLNYNNKYITLKHELSSMKDKLTSMCHDHDYWCKKAHISTNSLHHREAADLKQACLFFTNAPLAHPIDTPGTDPSLGVGSLTLALTPPPQETLLNTDLMQVSVIEPHPKSHPRLTPDPLKGHLQEAPIFMFPPFNTKEQPYRVQVLLDGTKYLHIHFSDNMYQFEDPYREDVLRNIRLGITPLIQGTIPSGAMHLINTLPKFKELYDLIKKEVKLNNENSSLHIVMIFPYLFPSCDLPTAMCYPLT